MKVISHRTKSRNETMYFTVNRITRETLGLIVAFARDGIDAYCKEDETGRRNTNYDHLRHVVKLIDLYLNADAMARHDPLVVPDYASDEHLRSLVEAFERPAD